MTPVRRTKKDYYEILGVPRNATKEQIDAAFAKLAMKWHPDRVPPEKKEEAERRFKEISEAYSVLSDPEKRRLYDMGVDPEGGAPGGATYDFSGMGLEEIFERIFGRGFGGFEDIFSDVFGFHRRRVEREEDLDVYVDVNLSLEEIVRGTVKRIGYRRRVLCPRCGGAGVENPRVCGTCGGTGRVRRQQGTIFGFFVIERPCPTCGGTGTTGDRCTRCGGKGYVYEEVEEDLEIPAGVLDGQKVVYRGRGHVGRSGRGRLVIRVHEKPHNRFKRRERDVIYTAEISPARAVLGGEIGVPDLEGGVVKVKVPRGVQHGEVFTRLKGRGVPDPKTGKRGDLLVEARIRIPTEISKRERKLYEELLKLEEQP